MLWKYCYEVIVTWTFLLRVAEYRNKLHPVLSHQLFVVEDELVQLRCSPIRHARHHSKRRHQWMGVIGTTLNGCRDTRCPSARRLEMVREDTWVLNKRAAYVWTAVNEAIGSKRACRLI
ncbi:hypothetical protein TNCV_551801 [Trichonephila clavipes]|nr:hypothetical protein TNCV_551801 [Trichonephila clavipes]